MSSPAAKARVLGWLVLALSLAACAANTADPGDASSTQPREVTLTMQEFAFEPAEISATVGQPVKLTLVNKGALLHDFTSMDAEVEVMSMDEGAEHEMDEMDMEMMRLHTAVDIGHTETIEFTPTQAGTYTFFCTVEGHQEAGMGGKIVVAP